LKGRLFLMPSWTSCCTIHSLTGLECFTNAALPSIEKCGLKGLFLTPSLSEGPTVLNAQPERVLHHSPSGWSKLLSKLAMCCLKRSRPASVWNEL
jgi:hypothetical protein